MKIQRERFLAVFFLMIALAAPAFAQWGGHGAHRLSPDDQRRFDSYYSRWVEYKQTNNYDQVRSMEGRMDTLKAQYRIPPNVPYWRIASRGGEHDWEGGYRWRPMLSPDDQRRYDSYYSRWLDYRRTNNVSQMASMQRRMDDVKAHYNIGPEVPYDRICSPNVH